METEETLPEEMPTEESPQEVPDNDWWVDPLVVIETLTNSMYCVADSDIDSAVLKKINDDFTTTLYQAHKLLRIKLKQQIEQLKPSNNETVQQLPEPD